MNTTNLITPSRQGDAPVAAVPVLNSKNSNGKAFRACTLSGLLIILIVIGGCRTFTPPAQRGTIGTAGDSTVKYVHFEATRRATYFRLDSDGKVRIAAEPPPDVAMDATVDLAASLKALAVKLPVEGEIDAKVIETIAKLTERTQAVVLMRDAMFRIAEMHLNEVIDDRVYQALFNNAMAGALAIAASDSDLGKAMLTVLVHDRGREVAVLATDQANRDALLSALEYTAATLPPDEQIRFAGIVMAAFDDQLMRQPDKPGLRAIDADETYWVETENVMRYLRNHADAVAIAIVISGLEDNLGMTFTNP